MNVSRRARGIPPSITFAIDARVRELKAQGVDVVGLGAGQPDFPTPPAAIEAAKAFVDTGRIGYTATAGLPELREAAARLITRVSGADYGPTQVVVTCGAKEALALSIATLCDPGDEVLLPLPAWISYGPMAQMVDVTPTTAETSDTAAFKLTPEALDAAITPRTRAVVMNSPSNPTGAVYDRDELAALAEVIVARDIAVISDEIYWPFVFEGTFVSPASLPGMAERTMVVNGLSKSHSMTGWRLGFACGPEAAIQGVLRLKSHLTSNASAPAQHAGIAALGAGTEHTEQMFAAFAQRRKLALEALREMPGVRLAPPAGAFYVFPRVDAAYGDGITGSVDFCEALLEEARVAAVPGAAFGEDRCIRLSIAAADDVLAEGLRRLGEFIAPRAKATTGTAS